MTDYSTINYIAVLVATFAGFLLGGIWYSERVFGEAWLDAIGKSKEEISGTGKAMLFSFFTSFFTAYVLALFVQVLGTSTIVGGALVGLTVALGFVATSMYSDHLFCNWPRKLFLIQGGYRVLALCLMGAILAAF